MTENHKNEPKRIRVQPWAKMPCAFCGQMVLATRGEAKEIDPGALACDACDGYHRGFADAMKLMEREGPA